MPSYKLSYFTLTALAEPIRFLLSYMGEEFEDFRFNKEDWPAIKQTMPFGKVPALEIDGKVVHQSTPISRYLGKQAKLAGKNDWEALQIDVAVDTLHDMRLAIVHYWYDEDEESRAKKYGPLVNEILPFYLSKFDELAKENNGYLANCELSWGDLYFVAISDYLNTMLGFDFYEGYENLKRLRDNVLSLPKIQEWINKRPKKDIPIRFPGCWCSVKKSC
ncbi:glutathione S-transferase [Halyomorpha halys]|uniref:glutathione S-transferase n=1 Tax=Halyomorpha halys TaxID=286706 RepID=UPI0006D4FEEB|nr:glutathione S-transferase-like [Halyomorpha halys]XP_014283897.1 glutathione S-transferase-like [Halyomorpha halys]